jgi:hypothetical protein
MTALLALFGGELAIGGATGLAMVVAKNPLANKILKTFGTLLFKKMKRPLTAKEKELLQLHKDNQTQSDLVHGYR